MERPLHIKIISDLRVCCHAILQMKLSWSFLDFSRLHWWKDKWNVIEAQVVVYDSTALSNFRKFMTAGQAITLDVAVNYVSLLQNKRLNNEYAQNFRIIHSQKKWENKNKISFKFSNYFAGNFPTFRYSWKYFVQMWLDVESNSRSFALRKLLQVQCLWQETFEN